MRLFRITREALPQWQEQLEALEHRAVYPLGDDAFRLSHGEDYFAFFERLGTVFYYALEDGGRLVAVGCGVLRPGEGGTPRRWYAGDLKVHPDSRGRHVPVALMRRAIPRNYLRCARGYGIAMNPAGAQVPPAFRSFAYFKWLPVGWVDFWQLDIYAADDDGMTAALSLLEKAAPERGRPHFVSLLGVKDLLLESTGKPLPLLHLRYGVVRDARTFERPQRGHTHMWCVPRESPLTHRLASEGFVPTASATVGSHRLPRGHRACIDTSEI